MEQTYTDWNREGLAARMPAANVGNVERVVTVAAGAALLGYAWRQRSRGLTVRQKILFQVLISLAVGVFLLYLMNVHQYETKLNVPFFKAFAPTLLIERLFATPFWVFGYLPFLIFVAIVIVAIVLSSLIVIPSAALKNQ